MYGRGKGGEEECQVEVPIVYWIEVPGRGTYEKEECQVEAHMVKRSARQSYTW